MITESAVLVTQDISVFFWKCFGFGFLVLVTESAVLVTESAVLVTESAGFGYRISGFGYRIIVTESAVLVTESAVLVTESAGFGYRISGFGYRIRRFGYRIRGFSYRISAFSYRISAFSYRIIVTESDRLVTESDVDLDGRTEGNFGGRAQSLVGENEKNRRQLGIEHVWSCDASDVIDGEECIISIMRGLRGNVSRLLTGVGCHVDDRGQRARKVIEPPPGKGDVHLWCPLK